MINQISITFVYNTVIKVLVNCLSYDRITIKHCVINDKRLDSRRCIVNIQLIETRKHK